MLILAAIASSIARPPERDRAGDDTSARTTETGGAPTAPAVAAPRPGRAATDLTTIRFSAGGRRELRKLEQGRPATVLVQVDAPGQVEIPSLGLTQPAEPLTPARFDVLVPQPGSHPVLVRPAAPSGTREAPVGTLKVLAGAARDPSS